MFDLRRRFAAELGELCVGKDSCQNLRLFKLMGSELWLFTSQCLGVLEHARMLSLDEKLMSC